MSVPGSDLPGAIWMQAVLEGRTFPALLTYYVVGLTALTALFRRPSSPFREVIVVAATQVLAIPLFFGMVLISIYLWFSEDGVALMEHDRLFGTHPLCWRLVVFTFWYLAIELVLKVCHQVYERRLTPKPQETIQYMHHVCTIALCIHSLEYGFVHYFVAFYIGIAEGSSIPLGVMNLFKMSKEFAAAHPKLNIRVSLVFALSFLFIRVLWWSRVNVSFWTDLVPLLSSERAADRRGIPAAHLYLWLFANAFLTAMQYYWGRKVVAGILKAIRAKSTN